VINPGGADGSLAQVGLQALGVVVTLAFSGAVSFALYKLVGAVTPLRADEQDEWTGMDEAEAGERGYITADMDSAPGAAASHGVPGAAPLARDSHSAA
jgi:Amt family ammonium transporter